MRKQGGVSKMGVDSKKFKIALIKAGMSMKEFCKSRNIEYSEFNLAINGFSKMKESSEKAVRDFLSQK